MANSKSSPAGGWGASAGFAEKRWRKKGKEGWMMERERERERELVNKAHVTHAPRGCSWLVPGDKRRPC